VLFFEAAKAAEDLGNTSNRFYDFQPPSRKGPSLLGFSVGHAPGFNASLRIEQLLAK
jgi:hypothetical protein